MADGHPHDVADKQRHHNKARDDAGDEQLADRHLGQHAPDDHQHRRRNQHAQAGAAGNATQRELALVAEAAHFGVSNLGESRRSGNRHAGDKSKHGIGQHRGHTQPAGNAAGGAVDQRKEVRRRPALG